RPSESFPTRRSSDLAKESGLIKDEYQRSATDIRMQRNHTFDLESLNCLVRDTGFSVMDSGSYFIKPFTHAQMQQLIDAGMHHGRSEEHTSELQSLAY